MTEKQLLQKYLAERVQIDAAQAKLDTRRTALDGVIGALRVVLGEVPPRRTPSTTATGTKALILDVLADGARRGVADIAAAIKVKTPACGWHLKELVAAGDVVRHGKSRSTTYSISSLENPS
jgi:hypothetical protein